jgi:hypothetical protein
MSRTIFQIEAGQIGLKIVDKAAVGYLDAWQAPAGKTVDTVTLADYETGSAAWSCQIIGGAERTPSTDTTDVPATWCELPRRSRPRQVNQFEFSGSFLQDPNVAIRVQPLPVRSTTPKRLICTPRGARDDPPKMIGRVRIASGTIGGEARTNLTSDFTLPLTRKPDVEFGDATTSDIVEGGDVALAAAAEGSGEEAAAKEPATV